MTTNTAIYFYSSSRKDLAPL